MWEEARGCPVQDTARPKTHTADTAESHCQAGDTSGRTCLRKGTPESEESGEGTSPWNSRYTLQPMQDATVEHKDIPEGTETHGEPTSKQSKDMMRKQAERHLYVLAATPMPSELAWQGQGM